MSAWIKCSCPGRKKNKMLNWYIIKFKCHHSAFNGYKYAYSDYSQIRCSKCNGTWRSKSKYVYTLKFYPVDK